ncbi:GIY-YIG nuclease family protein [Fischerella sp. PCC 9605]|uniref:GIY-YIG nuclease family protein n=1 Tax=Fischerella sp. PCC 9605 TaxID=1173024 RepID=UPI00047918FC|nr:GIY-YIG nuclease family protein [Fischerella sp. PCC 9605]
MINPATIDLKSLPWLPLNKRSVFTEKSCIYFAIDSLGTVQYIGRAKNVRSRWLNHHKYSHLNRIGNIKIAYLSIDTPELLPKIEIALIDYFKPCLNGRLKKKRETVSKTTRLISEINEALQRYADEQLISENAAINQLLKEILTQKGYLSNTTDVEDND